jgi:hypothetical protein
MNNQAKTIKQRLRTLKSIHTPLTETDLKMLKANPLNSSENPEAYKKSLLKIQISIGEKLANLLDSIVSRIECITEGDLFNEWEQQETRENWIKIVQLGEKIVDIVKDPENKGNLEDQNVKEQSEDFEEKEESQCPVDQEQEQVNLPVLSASKEFKEFREEIKKEIVGQSDNLRESCLEILKEALDAQRSQNEKIMGSFVQVILFFSQF